MKDELIEAIRADYQKNNLNDDHSQQSSRDGDPLQKEKLEIKTLRSMTVP